MLLLQASLQRNSPYPQDVMQQMTHCQNKNLHTQKPIHIMNKILYFFGFIFLLIISSCNNDDDTSFDESFLSGALTSATNQNLEGRWAIYQVEFEGDIRDVPPSSADCGRDFFDIQSQSQYREYLVNTNSECTPQINLLSWSLSDGIITLSNGSESDQLVVTELTSNRLVFKIRADINSDGELEIYKAICRRYDPPKEMDLYSRTFQWKSTAESLDQIRLSWDAYRGYNQFEKYEIYRLDVNCNKANAELISTITDVNQSLFVDLTPPPYEEICYLFKIYTNEGLLGESDPVNVDTSFIEVPLSNLSEPNLTNSTVDLNWEQYQGKYFSHYEIEVRNYDTGSGSGFQEEQLVIISDVETTNYTIVLPYFANPVFVIHVYNIFGQKSGLTIEGQNQQSTNFVRGGILPVKFIKFATFSPNESVLYFSDYDNLYRYNYANNAIESSTELNSSSIIFVKVFESSFGTEVIVNTGTEIKVYDTNLNFKYNLTTTISTDHLAINEDGYWLSTDRENLYSFSRTNNELELISTNTLYNESFSSSLINVINLGQNKIFAGNYTQSQGLIVNIDASGVLSNAVPVTMNATSEWKNDALYSSDQQYLLNREDNTFYSTSTYELVTSLSQGFLISGISSDGSLILGTNNNPESSNDNFHEKKARTVSYPSQIEQIYDAKGYPHIVYRNHLGQLVSISKGLLGKLSESTPERDIFVEIIE